jgi:O-acetyl-ADP-ribose deacetylase (regulator of RNase III)
MISSKSRRWSCLGTNGRKVELVKLDRFIIVTPNSTAAEEIRWATRASPLIETVLGKFEEIPNFDCVATAGNSFGLMDAGMDLAVLKFFGPQLQERIQRGILDDYLGEQPVGTCLLISTGNARHPFVAHAPTMRIPMNISGTDHVYLATWAVLTAIHRHNRASENRIRTLVCPAFGTGTGGVSALEAGTQMRIAYDHFLKPPLHINPSIAQARHERVHYGGHWGFQHPRRVE